MSVRWGGSGRVAAAGVRRSNAAASRRDHACRFHRQREPRAAHAARLASGLYRYTARLSPRRCRRARRFLAIMKTQANRMARLIDDLLSLSRVELIEHMHPETPVDLIPVVRQVTDGLQTLAQDRNVEIKIGQRAESVMVAGDRDELTRVFENLASRTRSSTVRTVSTLISVLPKHHPRTALPKFLSRYATTVRASRPSTFRVSPSASTASTFRKAGPKAAQVLVSRWSSTSSIATAASSRSRVRPAEVRRSRYGSR